MTSEPTAVPTPATPQSGVNTLPPPAPASTADPALEGFTKIAAERRSRVDEAAEPITIPFGVSDTIRIYAVQPAIHILGLADAERDPGAAINSIKACIIEEDRPKFETALKLPPTNPQGIDAQYLMQLLLALAKFYGAVPLDAS